MAGDWQSIDSAPKDGTRQMVIVSLGAGVQSTTLVLMAACGELEPMPAGAIFADTKSEPASVYRHLNWLEKQLPFPVYRVTVGSLRDEILGAMQGTNRMDARPPFFTRSGGMLNRQCTQDFKIRPIHRQIRKLLGLAYRARGPKHVVVEQWLGISIDEASRMRTSEQRWLQFRYPLIERGISRSGCLAWLERNGYPRPPKSACIFCPYHDDAMWRAMKQDDPESFTEAVAIDEAIRPGIPGPKRPAGESWYLHRQRIPLREVDLSTAEDRGQINMFNDECAGVCGV